MELNGKELLRKWKVGESNYCFYDIGRSGVLIIVFMIFLCCGVIRWRNGVVSDGGMHCYIFVINMGK